MLFYKVGWRIYLFYFASLLFFLNQVFVCSVNFIFLVLDIYACHLILFVYSAKTFMICTAYSTPLTPLRISFILI